MICAESSYAPCRRSAHNFARRHTTEVAAETIETTILNPNTEVTTEETKVVAYERRLVAENAVTEEQGYNEPVSSNPKLLVG